MSAPSEPLASVPSVEEAVQQLRDHQKQIDTDGAFVGVSRQALDEVLSALTTAQKQAESGKGYMTAFYEVSDQLGIPAQPLSPKQVFEDQIVPRLRALTTAEHERDDATRAALVRAREAVRTSSDVVAGRYQALAAIDNLIAELPNTEKDG